ncbi:MAG: glycosyltransferase [Planctomycetota bacterium]
MVVHVLYVGMGEDWGNLTRGVGYEEPLFQRSLASLPGVSSETFDYMALLARRGRADMSKMLARRVRESRPDLLFLVLLDEATAPSRETVREITETTDTTTALWVCDDPWQFDEFSRHWAPCVDWIITTDEDTLPRYSALGRGSHTLLLQWGCHPDKCFDQRPAAELDVSFVGQPHSDRRRLVQRLRDCGIRVSVFGHGWGEGSQRMDYGEMLSVFRRSKINLNFGRSIRESGLQIKARNFEVPGCGGFMLSSATPHLDRYFVEGHEVVTFGDEDDLLEKVRYYLDHDDERLGIARRGWQRCVAEHSWRHRWCALLERTGLERTGTARR